MAQCAISALSIPTSAVCSSSTSPALGRITQRRFPSLRFISAIGIASVHSRSTHLVPCQDGRRNDHISNEDGAQAEQEEGDEEMTDRELDMSTLEIALARSFGTAIWYTVLIVALAIFAGGYVFFLVKYGQFGDVPILSVPEK